MLGSISGMEELAYSLMKPQIPSHVLGAYPKKEFYILNGVAVKRPDQNITYENGVLSNLPVPCKIVINNIEYDCSDDVVELEFDYVGTHSIKVTAFPYLDWVTEVQI
jgi:hypothetical protein